MNQKNLKTKIYTANFRFAELKIFNKNPAVLPKNLKRSNFNFMSADDVKIDSSANGARRGRSHDILFYSFGDWEQIEPPSSHQRYLDYIKELVNNVPEFGKKRIRVCGFYPSVRKRGTCFKCFDGGYTEIADASIGLLMKSIQSEGSDDGDYLEWIFTGDSVPRMDCASCECLPAYYCKSCRTWHQLVRTFI